jgi:hypothetical protein
VNSVKKLRTADAGVSIESTSPLKNEVMSSKSGESPFEINSGRSGTSHRFSPKINNLVSEKTEEDFRMQEQQ